MMIIKRGSVYENLNGAHFEVTKIQIIGKHGRKFTMQGPAGRPVEINGKELEQMISKGDLKLVQEAAH